VAEAVLSRPDCKFVLLTNGLDERDDPRWFDLILELGELPTANRSDRGAPPAVPVIRVEPVTLLDEGELLSRAAALEALALDATKPSMLIRARGRLRSASLIARIVAQLTRIEHLQIAIEWDGENLFSSLLPDRITIIRSTASWHLNAFDFTLAEPDYFTFYDSIAHLLPTIFLTDDTDADPRRKERVKRAEAAGVAVGLSPLHLNNLLSTTKVLLEPKANEYMRSNCRKLRVRNGAGAAAEALVRLIT
jgi:hypothetical protein